MTHGPGYGVLSNHIGFVLKFYFSRQSFRHGFSVEHDLQKFCTVSLLFYQNSVDFLQISLTGDISYITTTYSEKPKGVSSRERQILRVFKILPIRGVHDAVFWRFLAFFLEIFWRFSSRVEVLFLLKTYQKTTKKPVQRETPLRHSLFLR